MRVRVSERCEEEEESDHVVTTRVPRLNLQDPKLFPLLLLVPTAPHPSIRSSSHPRTHTQPHATHLHSQPHTARTSTSTHKLHPTHRPGLTLTDTFTQNSVVIKIISIFRFYNVVVVVILFECST